MTAGKVTVSSVALIGLHCTSVCIGHTNASLVWETASFMHRWATANLISQSQRKCDLRHDQVCLHYPLIWLHMLKPFSIEHNLLPLLESCWTPKHKIQNSTKTAKLSLESFLNTIVSLCGLMCFVSGQTVADKIVAVTINTRVNKQTNKQTNTANSNF